MRFPVNYIVWLPQVSVGHAMFSTGSWVLSNSYHNKKNSPDIRVLYVPGNRKKYNDAI